MLAFLKYNFKLFIKTNKFFVPIIVYMAFVTILYNDGSNPIEMDTIFCSNLLFVLSVWIGYLYFESGNNITEQVVYLKINNFYKYFSLKILFLFMIDFIVAVINILITLIFDIAKYNCTLINSTSIDKFILCFIIFLLCSYTGNIIGMVFTPRIIKSRDRALLFVFAMTFVTLLKQPIIKEIPFFKYILWLVPPIYDLFVPLMNNCSMCFSSLIIPIALCILYAAVFTVVFFAIMKKNLFSK